MSDNHNDNVEAFNQLVNQIIKEEMAAIKKQPTTNGKGYLTIDFDASVVNTTDKPIISVRFTAEGMMNGMAHPFHHHRVLNFDLDSGETLSLEDLFQPDSDYLNRIAEYSRDVLNRKLRDKGMLMEGTTPTSENYKNWNLNPRGILITFDEYQVAPYVYGTQTVLIPYSVVKHDIAPDSPLANCLKHQKRCLRNNLLTGGFIDQA
ncbi:MAG: DUF3298 domain-containing protein [Gammaproteobacteria bacterium]|nr:MAG: DUF3298 domain-containing protein [Gammaproteobacteria bacterium]